MKKVRKIEKIVLTDEQFSMAKKVIKEAIKNGHINKFAYLTFRQEHYMRIFRAYLKNIQFWRKAVENPFDPKTGFEPFKNIKPETGKVYEYSKDRVFGVHPDLGVIKLTGHKKKKNELRIYDLNDYIGDKKLIQILDRKTLDSEKGN